MQFSGNIKFNNNRVSVIVLLTLLLLNCVVTSIASAQSDDEKPSLELLKNFTGKNQLKLLNNRFRIDYEVDELLFKDIRNCSRNWRG